LSVGRVRWLEIDGQSVAAGGTAVAATGIAQSSTRIAKSRADGFIGVSFSWSEMAGGHLLRVWRL
jgi:hypothetical protein